MAKTKVSRFWPLMRLDRNFFYWSKIAILVWVRSHPPHVIIAILEPVCLSVKQACWSNRRAPEKIVELGRNPFQPWLKISLAKWRFWWSVQKYETFDNRKQNMSIRNGQKCRFAVYILQHFWNSSKLLKLVLKRRFWHFASKHLLWDLRNRTKIVQFDPPRRFEVKLYLLLECPKGHLQLNPDYESNGYYKDNPD